MNTHPLPRGCAFARRLLGLGLAFCLGLAATATASDQVSLNFVSQGTVTSGGATKDTANNHILTNPINNANDVIFFNNVNFGTTGFDTLEIDLRLAYGSGGQRIDARVGDVNGPLIATLYADATGTASSIAYLKQTATIETSPTGSQRLYLIIHDTPGGGVAPIRLRELVLRNRGPLSTFLKRDGIYIRNHHGKGDIVRLYGVNLGGWAIHEPWMTPLQFRNTPTLKQDHVGAIEVLTNRFNNATVADNILNELYNHYITDEDFIKMERAGINCIRLPIYWADYMNANGTFKRLPNGRINFSRIESVVEKAKERGMYVVIDLHGVQGSQNGHLHSGDQIGETDIPDFWTNSTYQENTRNLWREIARRFRSEPAVAGYDLLNEPAKGRKAHPWDDQIRDYVRTLYATIREVDPDHLVFFNVWSEYNHVGNLLNGYGPEDNLALSYHWYHFPAYTAGDESHFWSNWINNSALSRTNYPFPVWIGEFSYKDHHNHSQWANRLKQMTRYGVSWTKWSYKVRYNPGSPEEPGRPPGWGMYEAATTAGRLDLERDDQATLMQKARSWGTSAKFTENTIVTGAMTGAIALYGKPARPAIGGPITGLTGAMPNNVHPASNGPTQGPSGWGNFKHNYYVTVRAVDFGSDHDRFFTEFTVDATVGTNEGGGYLDIHLGSANSPRIGTVRLLGSGQSSARLERRPTGVHDVVLKARRTDGSSNNIGLIKRVSFAEPPLVTIENRVHANHFSVSESGAIKLSGNENVTRDQEEFFILAAAGTNPIASPDVSVRMLSRKTMKWLRVGANSVLETGNTYDNSQTLEHQRTNATQFQMRSANDTTQGRYYRSIQVPSGTYLRVAQSNENVMTNHPGPTIGGYEKFHLNHRNP